MTIISRWLGAAVCPVGRGGIACAGSQMANSDNPAVVSRPRSRRWLILSAIVGGGLVLVVVILFGVGPWLVVQAPLVKARAIVVLSRAMPLRAMQAAKL